MPKVNKLQSPKLRFTQSLLVAIFTQNFMRLRFTAMEKRHQNFPTHTSVCWKLFTVPVHLRGTVILFTPHYYDAESSANLLLLLRAFV